MKTIILVTLIFFLSSCLENTEIEIRRENSSTSYNEQKINNISKNTIKYSTPHYLSESAKNQIGIVTKYDTKYYSGGYPPKDRGACTDVIDQALRENWYNLKEKIDVDMKWNPHRYQSGFDSNINFRRVRNVKTFLDYHAEKVSTCISQECFEKQLWKAGDIVTFDQIPGSLWHIAIISDKTQFSKELNTYIPFIVHNYGNWVVEDNMLLKWPTKITGHYRLHVK